MGTSSYVDTFAHVSGPKIYTVGRNSELKTLV